MKKLTKQANFSSILSSIVKERSYYELLFKTNVMLEIQQISMVLSFVSVFFYGSYDLTHAMDFLVQNGLSSCTAQRLLIPFPHLLLSVLLLAYFFYRASGYRPMPNDWKSLMEYINREEEFKDFSTGKMIKRKGKLLITKMSVTMYLIVMSFVFVHLYGYFYGECRKFSEHVNNHINFFESFLIFTFLTHLFVLVSIFISREKSNGN